MSKQQLLVSLIDDSPLMLEGLRSVLSEEEKMDIDVEAYTIASLMNTLDHKPDIILLNQEFFENDTFSETNFRKNFPEAKLALFLSDIQQFNIKEAIHKGITGFFTKDMYVDLFAFALKTLHEGKYWFSTDIMQLVIKQYVMESDKSIQLHPGQITPPPTHLISPREYEVLQYLVKGYDNKKISKALDINESTVKNHIANMFRKNDVNARTPLVLKAIKNKWLLIDEKDPTE